MKFRSGDKIIEGTMRCKLTDMPYYLFDVPVNEPGYQPETKRYVVREDEIIKEGGENEEQIRSEEQNVKEAPPRRKRGRPRKLG